MRPRLLGIVALTADAMKEDKERCLASVKICILFFPNVKIYNFVFCLLILLLRSFLQRDAKIYEK